MSTLSRASFSKKKFPSAPAKSPPLRKATWKRIYSGEGRFRHCVHVEFITDTVEEIHENLREKDEVQVDKSKREGSLLSMCGLCKLPFSEENLPGLIMKKSIFNLFDIWKKEKGLSQYDSVHRGSTLSQYDSVPICTFCNQFFPIGEKYIPSRPWCSKTPEPVVERGYLPSDICRKRIHLPDPMAPANAEIVRKTSARVEKVKTVKNDLHLIETNAEYLQKRLRHLEKCIEKLKIPKKDNRQPKYDIVSRKHTKRKSKKKGKRKHVKEEKCPFTSLVSTQTYMETWRRKTMLRMKRGRSDLVKPETRNLRAIIETRRSKN